MVDTSGWELLGQQPWPEQSQISLDKVQGLVDLTPRRWRFKEDWPDALHTPDETGGDWGVTLPAKQPYWNVLSYDQLPIAGPNKIAGIGVGGYLSEESQLSEFKRRIEGMGTFVGIRDCLAMSFALDFTHQGGPDTPSADLYQTLIATEPAGGTSADERMRHAQVLVDQLGAFIQMMDCYKAAQIVTAVPSKDPATDFHLPVWLADQLAGRLNMEAGGDKVRTLCSRQSMRDTVALDRLEHLKGTIEVDPKCVPRQDRVDSGRRLPVRNLDELSRVSPPTGWR